MFPLTLPLILSKAGTFLKAYGYCCVRAPLPQLQGHRTNNCGGSSNYNQDILIQQLQCCERVSIGGPCGKKKLDEIYFWITLLLFVSAVYFFFIHDVNALFLS